MASHWLCSSQRTWLEKNPRTERTNTATLQSKIHGYSTRNHYNATEPTQSAGNPCSQHNQKKHALGNSVTECHENS